MPSEVRFALVRKALEHHGWTLDRVNGSHHVFVKEGEGHLTIPVHKGRVKPHYVRKVERLTGQKF